MSYSRWSNSRWYTFWSSMGSSQTEYKWPTQKLKDSQVFEICDFPSFYITYGELKRKSRSAVLHEVEKHFSEPFTIYPKQFVDGEMVEEEPVTKKARKPTWEELMELQDYFNNFIKDIDNHFRFWTFMKYEWYYPFRNKIYWKIKKLKKRYVKDRSK